MKANESKEIVIFRQKMKELRKSIFPKKEGEVWLYGSRARGDHQSDSDWDLLVLTEESDSYDNFKKYAFPFIQLGITFGQDVIPLIYSKREWEENTNTLFYKNVLADRISI